MKKFNLRQFKATLCFSWFFLKYYQRLKGELHLPVHVRSASAFFMTKLCFR